MTPITEVEGRRLTLSNLDKVLYPATGTTKGELLHHYARTAAPLLAHLAGRPASFLRYPDGAEGETFFSKNPPPGTPDWVKVADVPRSARRGGDRGRQVVVDGLAALMWAANLVVEFHTPQWRAAAPAVADRIVFDLDPGAPASVTECCRVALWLRERMDADGLHAYAKTSGAKGVHLLVPVRPAPSADVSAYAKRLAQEAEAAMPSLVVHRMTRSLRPGKVFVDHSQNSAAKTTATPYTVRARERPTVSAPVTWDEVAACAEGRARLAFLMDDIPGRLDEHGDLMAPLFEGGAALPS
ncbi:non-homologous end-joining DNA ligase [Streptomyces montanisoli]|uniref:Non-homologous end-joining DNA ligase n=1 Tax=Streptomyces montanisoli TaxID=2798581 RepID=A0A940MFS7_9ACTN|nr:non-homologous end-joining DNA ligase [Streptomyces montanisoli]MBP0459506.1 non-homologous end-joining DNA ligase [Streptomyces montanisoli]